MVRSLAQRSRFIELNRRELGEMYDALNFVTEEQAKEALAERKELLESLHDQVAIGCKKTKLDCNHLSPGCEICSQGEWSCLFINGRCNCRCFYCPSQQRDDGVPVTNTLSFPDVEDYLDYVEALEFKGVSLSGGEPLLTLDTSLQFLRAIKERWNDNLYMWLYTNGTLATEESLQKLRDAGLNEIRFDIGATSFKLDAAIRAVPYFDTVTVEIPSIPEEFELMKGKIVEMEKAGIRHLNLHQLRVTPYNLLHLIDRDYTFLHGERVTVLESERAALKLIQWTKEKGIELPINYCSFVYKNRFQRAAARRKSAGFVKKPYEDITENGYMRWFELRGNPEDIKKQMERFQPNPLYDDQWEVVPAGDRLFCSEVLWPWVDASRLHIFVTYAESRILPNVTYRNPFTKWQLNPNRIFYVEKSRCQDPIKLDEEMFLHLCDLVSKTKIARKDPAIDPTWERILYYEQIEENLADYF